jgi:hypothetical protein
MELRNALQLLWSHEFESANMSTDVVLSLAAGISPLVGTNESEIPVLDITPDPLMPDLRFKTMVKGAKTDEIVRSVFSTLGRGLHMMDVDRNA